MNSRRRGVTACVNGKWLAQSPSGTQRYASQVLKAMSRMRGSENIMLVLPRDAVEPSWAANFITVRSRFRGLLFEQVHLPWIVRGRHLYSMAGPAPLVKRNQTLVMHDAMPFRFPGTFRHAFVLWYWLLYGVLSRSAKRVMTVSDFSRRELASTLHVPQRRFELAPCGSDHMEEEIVRSVEGLVPFGPRAFALMVGNLAPHKNIAAAASALAAAGVPVAVVGTEQQVFRQVKIEDGRNLRLLGRVDDAEVARLYAEAAVLVAPSRYEGFGIPIVEAARLGCPVVFARGSAMTEVAGEGGLGFDPDDMDECVELVKLIMSNDALRATLGTSARKNADRFSWDRTARRIFSSALEPEPQEVACELQGPLRVLHVTETFSAGTGTAIIEYAHAAHRHGIESFLLAQDRGSGLLTELTSSSPFEHAEIVPPGLVKLWRALRSTVADVRPDIVHLHSSLAGAVGRLQLPLPGRPVIVYSPHCFAFERRDIPRVRRMAYRTAELLLARRTDGFVCVSPHEAELARSLGSSADIGYVLNSFTTLDRAVHAGPSAESAGLTAEARSEAIGVVTVGRIAAQKDPQLFLDIVSALRSANPVNATWVGDGVEGARGVLEANDVSVTGWLPAGDVPDAMRGHTVYVHTAGWEASVPIAALDAMRAGLPVVVKYNAAYRSILPEEWQFDDVSTAVQLILDLNDHDARQRRISDQFNLIAELQQSSADTRLAHRYRHIAAASSNGALLCTQNS